jgi:chromosome segregation ATPase
MNELITPLIIFGLWTLFSVVFIQKYKLHQTDINTDKKSFWNNTYIFESIPPVFPTLGIFCTALGITIGIWDFNTDDIQGSIPELLKGLRLAFVATMAGILGLIIFQKVNAIVQKEIDDNPNRPRKHSDELTAISELTLAIQELKREGEEQNKKLIDAIGVELNDRVASKLASLENEVKKSSTSELEALNKISTTTNEAKNEISEQLKKLREEQKATSEKANQNTDQIIATMKENNKLIGKKFDEFSELLKQNNTEALVEVMKRTTEQFNAQMSDLINRLVKENFSELNDSVKKLNQWQLQNKEQVQKLTDQFQKTTELFTISATTLKQVAENTKSLTDDDSKLNIIIRQLNKVMIEDGKFQDITDKLTATIETLGKTTDSFDETTSKLNDWVKTEKNFKESAQILIAKLEEFRDFKSDVWNNYRAEMQSAVNSIQKASKTISNDLDNINAEFYTRLNSTLQNLDECIQRFVPTNNR